ncbi:3-dehydroquinate synthase [Myxococcota bacterium]|nr:3-dehydroquinate synthase [Myxococcota bacterium]MBU1535122.1 3-dehydroquinate synthase [Myxococcota bacterium]
MTCERTISFGHSRQVLVKSSRDPIGDAFSHAAPYSQIFIISDTRVADLHGPTLLDPFVNNGRKAQLITFSPGEQSKTLHTLTRITGELLDHGVGKDDVIIGFGGGVTTDLAGFAASLIKRGIPWLAIPTTFLGAVDAAIGGKTGVNTAHGKNLLGTFFPPFATIISTVFFSTLGAEDLKNGWVECVKAALIGNGELFCAIEEHHRRTPCLEDSLAVPHQILWDGARVKMDLIRSDPMELGVRSHLNLGHTVGHAVEMASGGELSHGQAVAMGMVKECTMAASMGLLELSVVERVKILLSQIGLHTELTLPVEACMDFMTQDKKNRGGKVGFSMPRGLGVMGDTVFLTPQEIVKWWT